MEEVIVPYIIDSQTISLTVTPRQLEDIRSAVEALNKRRIVLRNKMSSRRESKGTSTKPFKPVIKIDFPQYFYSPVHLSLNPIPQQHPISLITA